MIKKILVYILFLAPHFAYADGAVIVNKNSQISQLNKTQVQQIFLKKSIIIQNEKPVVAAMCNKCDIVSFGFNRNVLGKDSLQLRAYWTRRLFTEGTPPPLEFQSDEDVLEFIEKNENSIGIIERNKVKGSVKVVFEF